MSTTLTSFNIPSSIINFKTTPVSKHNTAVNSQDRAASRALLEEIKNGATEVTGNLADWLETQVTDGQSNRVILMLRQQDAVVQK